MPLEIADYDINKMSFIAANNRDNLYIVYYNYVKANLLSGYINIGNNKIIMKRNYNSNKLYFTKPLQPTKQSDNSSLDTPTETTNSHVTNFNEFIKFIDKIKGSLSNDFVKKRLTNTNTNPILSTPYNIILTVKTNKSNNINGAITHNGTKYTIRLDELMCVIKSDIICRLEVCPEYFYLGKCSEGGGENFRLGVTLKSIHIEEDQLHKLPKRIEILIKYGITKDKIHDIKLLDKLYNTQIIPQYKSKKTIIDNILDFDK